MTKDELINSTKDIVIAMINSKLLVSNSQNEANSKVTKAMEEIYDKLVELNLKDIKTV